MMLIKFKVTLQLTIIGISYKYVLVLRSKAACGSMVSLHLFSSTFNDGVLCAYNCMPSNTCEFKLQVGEAYLLFYYNTINIFPYQPEQLKECIIGQVGPFKQLQIQISEFRQAIFILFSVHNSFILSAKPSQALSSKTIIQTYHHSHNHSFYHYLLLILLLLSFRACFGIRTK